MILVLCWLIFIVTYSLLIAILFMLFFLSSTSSWSIVWSHDVCTYTIPSFLQTHWKFWLYRFAYPGIWLLHFIDQVFREKLKHYEEPKFPLLDHPFLVSYRTFFYSFDFYWFSIAWTPYYFIWFIRRMMLSLCRNYMLYCSDFIAFIADLYNLFRSL